MAKFCKYCGYPVHEGANFCQGCGKNIATRETNQNIPRIHPPPTGYQPAGSVVTELVRSQEYTAEAMDGEINLGELMIPGISKLAGQTGAEFIKKTVSSPITGVFHYIGAFFGGIFKIFVKPKALIGTLILAVLWFVLGLLRDSNLEIVKVLSWLTFAEGGYDRSMAGVIGGVIGKGTVGAALMTLLPGGIPKAVKGAGALFTGHGEKRSIAAIVIGVVLGIIIFLFFTGPDLASAGNSMAGIAGALLSLEALGSGGGKLYELVESLTSRVQGGVRTAVIGRTDGLLTGLSLGFVLSTAISCIV